VSTSLRRACLAFRSRVRRHGGTGGPGLRLSATACWTGRPATPRCVSAARGRSGSTLTWRGTRHRRAGAAGSGPSRARRIGYRSGGPIIRRARSRPASRSGVRGVLETGRGPVSAPGGRSPVRPAAEADDRHRGGPAQAGGARLAGALRRAILPLEGPPVPLGLDALPPPQDAWPCSCPVGARAGRCTCS
jgi:hypothetical protein